MDNKNKDNALRQLESQQRIRARQKYTEAIKLREQTIEANTNKDLKQRFKQL